MLTLFTQQQAHDMEIASERKQARAEGYAEGFAEGYAEGILISMLRKYMQRHHCDAETAMDDFDIDPSQRPQLIPYLLQQ